MLFSWNYQLKCQFFINDLRQNDVGQAIRLSTLNNFRGEEKYRIHAQITYV